MNAVKYHMDGDVCGIKFCYQSGMLFITLPSGRRLSYVKPKLGTNQFGSECITYEGIGGTKKWERLETYGPKLVENIVQATSRDILCYAMRTLSHCFITMHIHANRWAGPHRGQTASSSVLMATRPCFIKKTDFDSFKYH